MLDGVRTEVKAKPRRDMLRVAMFDHSSLIVQGITVEEKCRVKGESIPVEGREDTERLSHDRFGSLRSSKTEGQGGLWQSDQG